MKITQDVKSGKLKSAYAIGVFDKAKETLESNGYRVISLQENAQLRMQEGVNSSVSTRGNWTREGVLYVPNKGIYLVRNSPIMNNAEEARYCHRDGKEFYLTNEQVEKSLADSVKFERTSVATNDFASNPITAFAFGKDAKAYGEFLKDAGKNSIENYVTSTKDKPFAGQMWLCRLGGGSGSSLGGDDGDLDCDYVAVRAVRSAS